MNKLRRTPTVLRIEEGTGEVLEEAIIKRYIHEGQDMTDIAEEFGVSLSTVYWWIQKMGIVTVRTLPK